MVQEIREIIIALNQLIIQRRLASQTMMSRDTSAAAAARSNLHVDSRITLYGRTECGEIVPAGVISPWARVLGANAGESFSARA